jgi:TP901 family phage tail tape measure protein
MADVRIATGLPDDLVNSLNALSTTLTAIDSQLTKNIAHMKAVNAAFTNSNSVKNLIDSLKQFTKVETDPIKTVSAVLLELFESLKKVNALSGPVKNSINAMASFMRALALVAKHLEQLKTTDAAGSLTVVSTIVTGLSQFIRGIEALDFSKIKPLRSTINAVSDIVNAIVRVMVTQVTELKTNNLPLLIESFGALIQAFSNKITIDKRVFNAFAGLKKLQDIDFSKTIDSINRMVTQLLTLDQKIPATLDTKNLKNKLKSIIPTIIWVSRSFFNFSKQLTGSRLSIKTQEILKNFFEITKAVTRVFSTIANLQNVMNSLKSVTKVNTYGLSDFIKSLADNKDTSLLGIFKNAGKSFASFSLSSLNKIFTSKFVELVPIFEALKYIFNEIGKLMGGVTNFKGIEKLHEIATAVASLVKTVPLYLQLSRSKEITPGILAQLSRRFRILPRLFGVIRQIVFSFARMTGRAIDIRGMENLPKIAEAIQALVKAVPVLLKTIKSDIGPGPINFAVRSMLLIPRLMGVIRQVVRGIARIVGKSLDIEGIKSLPAIAQAVARVVRTVPLVISAARQLNPGPIGYAKRTLLQIPRFFGVFSQITKSLNKVTGRVTDLEKTKAVVNLVKDIVALTRLASVENATIGDFRNFQRATKEIVNSLDAINRVRIDQSTALTVKHIEILQQKLKQTEHSQISLAETSEVSMTRLNRAFVVLADNSPLLAVLATYSLKLVGLKKQVLETMRVVGNSLRQMGEDIVTASQTIFNNFSINKIINSSGAAEALEFDDIRQQIKVFASELTTQLPAVEEFANFIGQKYPLSSNEALQATLELAKAGQSFAAIKNILPNAADLAGLSETKDLKTSTNFLIAAAGQYKQFSETVAGGFQNSAFAADAVFNAANMSTAGINSLMEGLTRVGPAANNFGASLDEVVITLSRLEDAGIRGSDAGTALRAVFTGISNAKGQKELKRLGVAFQNVDGSIRNLGDIIADVQRRYKELGYSQADILKSTSQFGDELARTGFNILRNSKDITQGVTELNAAIAGGSTASIAMTNVMSSLKGIIEQIRGSVSTLLTKVFLPIFDRFVKPLATAVLALVNSLLELPDSVLETVGFFIAFAAAAATLLATLMLVVGAITTLSGFVLSAAGTIGLLMSNLYLMAGSLFGLFSSVIILIPVLTTLITVFTGLSYSVTRVFRLIEDATTHSNKSFIAFQTAVSTTFSELQRIFKLVQAVFIAFVRSMTEFNSTTQDLQLAGVFDRVTNSITNLNNNLKKIDLNTVVNAVKQLSIYLKPLFSGAANAGAGLFSIILGDFEGGVQTLEKGLSSIGLAFSRFLSDFAGFDLTKALIYFESNDLNKGVQFFVEEFLGSIRNAIDNNAEALTAVGAKILNFFNPLKSFSQLTGLLGFNNLSLQLNELAVNVENGFRVIISVIIEFIRGTKDASEILGTFFGSIGTAVGNLLEALYGIAVSIGDVFTSIFSVFNRGIATTPEQQASVEETVNWYDGIVKIIDNVTGVLNTLNTDVIQVFARNVPLILNKVATFIQGILDYFSTAINSIPVILGVVVNFLKQLVGVFSGEINISQAINDFLTNLQISLSSISLILGAFFERLGVDIQSNTIYMLSKAFNEQDFGQIILKVLLFVPELLYEGFSKVFDELLKLFPNRIAGAIAIASIAVLAGAVSILAFNTLPLIVTSAVGILQSLLLPPITALGRLLGFTLAGSIPTGFLVAAAAVVGVLGVAIAALVNSAISGPTKNIIERAGKTAGTTFTNAAEAEAKKFKTKFTGIVEDAMTSSEVLAQQRNPVNILNALLPADNMITQFTSRLSDVIAVVKGVLEQVLNQIFGEGTFFIKPFIAVLELPFNAIAAAISLIIPLIKNLILFIVQALQVVTAIVNQLIKIGLGVISGVFKTIEIAIKTVTGLLISLPQPVKDAALAFTLLAAAIKLVGKSVNTAGGMFKASAILIIFQAFVSLLRGLDDMFKNGLISGILTFFEDFTGALLNFFSPIVGTDIGKQIKETFFQLKFLASVYRDEIDQFFTQMFYRLLSILNDIRARAEIAISDLKSALGDTDPSAQSLGSLQYFGFQDAFAQVSKDYYENGIVAGKSFWEGLNSVYNNAEDPLGLDIVLKSNQDLLEAMLNDMWGGSLTPAAEAFKNDALFVESVIQTLSRAGQIDEFFKLDTGGDIEAISTLLNSPELIQALATNKEYINDWLLDIQALKTTYAEGIPPELTDDVKQLATQLDVLRLEGVIEETDSLTQAFDALGYAIVENNLVLKENAAEVINASYSLEEINEEVRETAFEEFHQTLEEGTETIDEYAQAVNKLIQTLQEANNTARIARIAQLQEQLETGQITDAVFRLETTEVIEDSFDLLSKDLNIAREQLLSDLTRGVIDPEQFNQQIELLDKALADASVTRDLELTRVNLQMKLNNEEITIDEFATLLGEAEKLLKEHQEDVADNAENTIDINYLTGDSDQPLLEDPTGEEDTDVEDLTAAAAKAAEDKAAALEDLQQAQDDLAEKERDLLDQITDLATDYRQKELEAQQNFEQETARNTEDFYRESQRNAADHQRQLLEIEKSSSEAIQDAIANRDSVAAQNAVRSRETSLREQEDQYTLEQQRRAEDFALSEQRRQEEYQRNRTAAYNEAVARRAELMEQLTLARTEGQEKIRLAQAAVNQMIQAERTAAAERLRAMGVFGQNGSQIVNSFVSTALNALNALVPGSASALNSLANVVSGAVNSLLGRTPAIGPAPAPVSLPGVPAAPVNPFVNAGLASPALTRPSSSSFLGSALGSITRILGGRESGGMVSSAGAYEVMERQKPELLSIKGKHYLMSPGYGKVTPPRVAAAGMGGSNLVVNVDLSGMQFNNASTEPKELAAMVERQVVSGLTSALKRLRG